MLYSIFNFAFNIQLFILYSSLYSPIQLSIQQFQPFILHSTLIFQTINCSFNIQLFWALTTSGQWHRSPLVKNRAAARMLATKIEAYEVDTRLHFDVESDLPRFLDLVLQRTDQISQTKVDEKIVEQHSVVVNQTVRLLRLPWYTLRQQFEY